MIKILDSKKNNFNSSLNNLLLKRKKKIKFNLNIVVNNTINRPLLSDINKYLKMLDCRPLYRIYAQYPKNKIDNKVWFHDIGKVTSNLEIKYIIPINSDTGIIMISYME